MKPIKDYFLIGSLHTTALVSKNGSIDWLCFPHFDSHTIFAKMLDTSGGSFDIEMPGYSCSSAYVNETAVVEHKFKNENCEFVLKDFMLPQQIEKCNNHFLIRKIESKRGQNIVKFIYNPMPNYAERKADLIKEKDKVFFFVGNDLVILHLAESTDVKEIKNGLEINVHVDEGRSKSLVLEYILYGNNSQLEKHDFEDETVKFWKKWIKKGKYFELSKDELERSMITLKLMQFYPTGALVAAPTTSLPEDIGGVRNWDYRYVWIRDATFTIYAFHILQCNDEAERFFSFIKKISDQPDDEEFHINVMYTIWGKEAPEEKLLDYLSGYENSRPVRIGNDATKQIQLDVYGALIDAHYFMMSKDIKNIKEDKKLLLKLLKKIEDHWKEKGAGIWEMRKKEVNFTYGKVMAWVGADRILKMDKAIGLSREEKKRAERIRSEIYNWIWDNCYDKKSENLLQYAGSENIDATNLLFVSLQFLDKNDKRTKIIVDNTCKTLCTNEVFVYRYLAEDGIKGEGKPFILCTFWMIAAYAILGEIEKAKNLFEKFKKYIAETGLLSEEINPETGEYIGNHPQAFSHMGFVMSAYYLYKYGKKRKE
jgi:GH15 family glucan-1,4-alpha-glucosidase